MLQITPPQNFKHIPWKNGQGSTIELAINEEGTVNDFDWRLSIATVNANGPFSDFSGYTRNLVLLEGNGLLLTHDSTKADSLERILQFSTFDGGNKTKATLINGPIKDFNLMTKTAGFKGRLETFTESCQVNLEKSSICFIYPTAEALALESYSGDSGITLNKGELAKMTDIHQHEWVINGNNFILISIENI